MGIDSAKTEAASQTLPLSAAQVASGERVDLRYVLYQKVSSLALFFPANFEGAMQPLRRSRVRGSSLLQHAHADGEQTVIERLAVYGVQVPQARRRRSSCRVAPRRGGETREAQQPAPVGRFCRLQALTRPTTCTQEGAAWAKDKDVQEQTAKGDWLGKGAA